MLDGTSGGATPPPSYELTPDEVQEELARILGSESFQKSPQLSRFLRFCVEETLAGQQDCLKEQVLGTDVFRRPAPFDPRLDPIVRVEARRLRSKLDQYYTGEGAADPVMISFQRGDYTPRFFRATVSDRPAPPARSARILVVEDERLVARDLEHRLTNLGYEVVGTAPSGEAALQLVEQSKPDMVLMDIVLAGGMRGTEVARRIWSGWRIPVVYLTAFSDALILEDVKGSEPYGYVLKPFDSKQLHAVLQLALSRRDRESADASVNRELNRNEGLLAALLNARILPWDWVVTDYTRPWPESLEVPSHSSVAPGGISPAAYLDRIEPEDRDAVQSAFTDAIGNGGRLEITYRRKGDTGQIEWAVAIGAVAADMSGRRRCSGLEVGASSAIRHRQFPRASEMEQLVDAAGSDLEAMQTLIKDLMTYTALSAHQHTPVEPLDLNEPLDLAMEKLFTAIVEAGAQITRTSLPHALVDKNHAAQLFGGLISNAIHSRREDITPEIAISATPCSGQWRISIRDNGVGLDPESSDQIFQPFKPLSTNVTPGAGLGLAICRRIVEIYGGRIWVESQPGQGSTFHFTLPSAESQSS